MLEKGETAEELLAAFVEKESGLDPRSRVAEAGKDFGPALDAVGVGGLEGDAEPGEMSGDGVAIELAAEEIAASDEAGESPTIEN